MNPDEVLKKALALAQAVTESRANPSPGDAVQIAEYLLALDRHLGLGGKLPGRWEKLTPLVPPAVTEGA